MKKNIMRIISLALVAVMVFAFASCKQEILVRFVDANGDDLFQAGSVSVNGDSSTPEDTTAAPVIEDTTAAPVVEDTTAAPVVEGTTAAPVVEQTTAAPVVNETTTAAPVVNETTTKAPEQTTAAPTTQAPPASSGLSSKQEIVDFYKKAANDLKNNGSAGYTKKEWQTVDDINITGVGFVDNAIVGVLGNFMTVEADAEEQINAKGSDDAKRRSFGWTLTDLSKVASAKCDVLPNGNYKITMVMVDEDTPKKSGSTLGQVTEALLYWEDIEDTLKNDPTVTKILTEYSGIQVIYKGFTITAEMTKDGKFVTLDHVADVDIKIGSAKILIATINNKSAHMVNTCKFYNFQY